jgi:mono/diheme cytochrome c family protein
VAAAILAANLVQAQGPRETELGRGIFRIHCAPCHGIHAQGGRAPDLTRGVFASGDSDDDLVRTIS